MPGVSAGYDLSLGGAFVGLEGELSTTGDSTTFPGNVAGARDGLETGGVASFMADAARSKVTLFI